MTHSRIRAGIGVAVATAALLAPSTPAQASVTGGLVLTCTTTLPVFPGAGGSSCAGVAVGAGAGLDTQGHPYVLAGPGNFVAAFGYSEACGVLSGLPVAPPLGSANGTATVSGLLLTSVHVGAPEVGSATLTTNFQWLRVGVTAVVTTTGTTVTLTPSGHTAVSASPVAAVADGAAVAVFAPVGAPGTCATPHATTAAVVGTAVFPL